MSEFSATAASLADIEARQDDLLRQLDELEKRIDRVLSDYAASGQSPARPARMPKLGSIAQPSVATVALGGALAFPAPAAAAR